ncbi:hypothetical protein [Parabacteroides sp. PF5-9]|uniref:hypothetical protein n=1 Tax=Parabacteroides sp. PF5-9 TaxID=1742404 RepID=UPI002476F0CD|nr:hypothetical protein [Parabacteroides sp. PF5-9]MDH6357221.1 hypothetical protein [Parabacteroides sp. PF5-9]
MAKVKNFARFYVLFSKMQGNDDDMKKGLVMDFTGGRTDSLRQMTQEEYNLMCNSLEAQQIVKKTTVSNGDIKRLRSSVLHRLQTLGVNTADWKAVDKFCLNKRIAGKKFYNLTAAELNALIPKLEAIARKPSKTDERLVSIIREPSPALVYYIDEHLQKYVRNIPSPSLN